MINLGDIFTTVLLLVIPVFIIGLLILLFISMKRKNLSKQLENTSSDGVSKKQIK